MLGEPEKARRAFTEALALARAAGRVTHSAWYQLSLAEAYSALGQTDEALRLLPSLADARDRQDIVNILLVTIRIYLDAGDVVAASSQAEQILPLFERRSVLAPELPLLDQGIEAFLRGGNREAAERLWALARTANGAMTDRPYLLRMAGRMALAAGDLATAQATFSQVVKFLAEAGFRDEEWRTRRALADAKARAGDHDGAEAELRAVLADAEAHGHIATARAARKQFGDLGVDMKTGTESPMDQADLRQASERLVTVMFLDVRGYTAMSVSEAPGQLAETIGSFYRWADHEIERHYGQVMHRAGDAVVATFNVSGVRLDHTLHALQAAIEIRDKASFAGLPLGAGIAVGAAVVGQLSEHSDLTVIGETPNLAARLQAQAGAGEILLSDEAFRRVRDWLADQKIAVDGERLSLKGFPEPVTAYRLLSASQG
jgi:class 3 adenylate cyclase